MHPMDSPAAFADALDQETRDTDLLAPLLQSDVRPAIRHPAPKRYGVTVGELLAIVEDGSVPLVRYAGQAQTAALRARTTVDLHEPHVGAPVVLMFDDGDPERPIVMGVLREKAGWPLDDGTSAVEVDADGKRLVVVATEELVLRCGKASITLTKAGRVIIEGEDLLSRASGVNRIKGGSVQLN